MARILAIVWAVGLSSAFGSAQVGPQPKKPNDGQAQAPAKPPAAGRLPLLREVPVLRQRLGTRQLQIGVGGGGAPVVIRGFSFTPTAVESIPLDPNRAGPAQRIWAPRQETNHIWVRRQFELPAGAHSAQIVVTCDNICTVHANGTKLARFEKWEEVGVVDSPLLRPGKNVVAIHAENQGSNAALVAWILWTDAKGAHHAVISDSKWRLTEEAPAEGWTKQPFDDTKWAAATEQAPTPFAKNTYGMDAQRVVRVNARTQTANAIAGGLDKYRAAKDAKTAHDALREIELALMQARQQLWQTEQKARKSTESPNSKQ